MRLTLPDFHHFYQCRMWYSLLFFPPVFLSSSPIFRHTFREYLEQAERLSSKSTKCHCFYETFLSSIKWRWHRGSMILGFFPMHAVTKIPSVLIGILLSLPRLYASLIPNLRFSERALPPQGLVQDPTYLYHSTIRHLPHLQHPHLMLHPVALCGLTGLPTGLCQPTYIQTTMREGALIVPPCTLAIQAPRVYTKGRNSYFSKHIPLLDCRPYSVPNLV